MANNLKTKLTEIFDLEKVKSEAESGIINNSWEDYYDNYKTCMVTIMVDGNHGVYIPGIVLDLFDMADDFDLETPHNPKNDHIHDALEQLEYEISDAINELVPMPNGRFYFGYSETCGDYGLFYQEDCLEIYEDKAPELISKGLYTFEELNEEFGFQFDTLPTDLCYTYSDSLFYPVLQCIYNEGSDLILVGMCDTERNEKYLYDLVIAEVETIHIETKDDYLKWAEMVGETGNLFDNWDEDDKHRSIFEYRGKKYDTQHFTSV